MSLIDIPWIRPSNSDIETERQQLIDEGKDLSSLAPELEALLENSMSEENPVFQNRAGQIMERAAELPERLGYSYKEPSDLESIRRLRPEGIHQIPLSAAPEETFDKIHGALLGRCCGCLLGKPVESWKSARIWGYLKDLNRFPLSNYFTASIPEKIKKKYEIRDPSEFGYLPDNYFIDRVSCMGEDDDTNYTIAAALILKRWGADFTTRNVAEFWLENIPLIRTCSAERITYKNLLLLIEPPGTAVFRNPHREGIGAQIRADTYGYMSPGKMEQAAEWAWRDARLSHVKNGIYGAMWTGAMIAGAYLTANPNKIIHYGLQEIPATSRLYEAVKEVLAWHAEGIDYTEAIERIHKRWNENSAYHWGHTISNAQIVSMALLWGDMDFEKSICRAVEACFDTDCNGATVGSIIGLCNGAGKLPEKWISPLNDRLLTCIPGYQEIAISHMARDLFNNMENQR